MSQIICNDLSLGYDSKPVVSGLSFSVSAGDYLCVVGENGSGKTTLMKTLLGLSRPLSGTVVFGDGLTQKKIGYLPQQSTVQRDFPASVKEIVLSGCLGGGKFTPFYTREQKKRAEKNMERMGITDLSTRCYRELSGGQQQRVLLARALSSAGKILLLDEPVSGLDPKVTEDMYDLIYSLNRDDKITVVMITHDISAAAKYATHILHIGTPVFFGTADEYFENNAFIKREGDGNL